MLGNLAQRCAALRARLVDNVAQLPAGYRTFARELSFGRRMIATQPPFTIDVKLTWLL
jgi:hypothetical protein